MNFPLFLFFYSLLFKNNLKYLSKGKNIIKFWPTSHRVSLKLEIGIRMNYTGSLFNV